MPAHVMINPLTGYTVRIGGPTYKKLMKQRSASKKSVKRSASKKSPRRSPRRSPKKSAKRSASKRSAAKRSVKRSVQVRGWARMSPKRGSERHKLLKNCGKKCFLDPKNEKYPICAKGKGCKINCGGLLAAKIRARQYKHDDIARLAERLEKKLCMM